MFMILGPNGPFTNLPPTIETEVEWISQLIKDAETGQVASVEPTAEAEEAWTETCQEIADMTLFPRPTPGSSAPTSRARRRRSCSTSPASANTGTSSPKSASGLRRV